MLTAHFEISAGRPSEHFPEHEAERTGSVDHDVTITIGSVKIAGGITLSCYASNGGPGTYYTPVDSWCSAEILRAIRTLTKASQDAILSTLACGSSANGREIHLDEPTAEERGGKG